MLGLTDRVDPRPLAVTRIALGVATLLTAGELWLTFNRIVDGAARVPVPGWPMPFSEAWLAMWLGFTVVAAIALIAGACSRTAAAAVARAQL